MKKGTLVDRARAETLVFRLARQERDVWVTWPARVAALMTAEVAAEVEKPSGEPVTIEAAIVQRVLETHVREQLGALADLFGGFPEVRIDLVTEGNLVDIVADGFDFGIRSQNLLPADMISIPIAPARRYAVVATPAYFEARERPRVPSDLLGHACIRTRLPNGAMFRWQFEAEGQPVQVDVDGPITLDEASLARIAVLDSIGIGFFMESDVREDLEAGRLLRILDDWTPALSPLCLYYPSRRNPPAAFKVFVDLARELARAARHR